MAGGLGSGEETKNWLKQFSSLILQPAMQFCYWGYKNPVSSVAPTIWHSFPVSLSSALQARSSADINQWQTGLFTSREPHRYTGIWPVISLQISGEDLSFSPLPLHVHFSLPVLLFTAVISSESSKVPWTAGCTYYSLYVGPIQLHCTTERGDEAETFGDAAELFEKFPEVA